MAAAQPRCIHVKLGDRALGVTAAELEAELAAQLAAFGPTEKFELYNTTGYESCPFAMVHLVHGLPDSGPAADLSKAGSIQIRGQACCFKPRRESAAERKRQAEEAERAALAEEERLRTARPAWQGEMLNRYPRRATTLDQATLVGALEPPLRENVELYLRQSFPGSEEVAGILLELAKRHPTSLRVKELFETVESAALIGRDIAAASEQARAQTKAAAKLARAAVAKGGNGAVMPGSSAKSAAKGITHIYDLACGHGLLGVLLAYRFSQCSVVCVDLEKRAGFEHIVALFEEMGIPAVSTAQHATAQAKCRVLPNLSFVEGDLSAAAIEPGAVSYVTCVHGCNEVSSRVVEAARGARAGWAVMPCCIRDGLYSVQSMTHVSDDQRYAAMVGVLAGTYQASLVAGIDRGITNRNLCAFGGWERPRMREREATAPSPHEHAVEEDHDC